MFNSFSRMLYFSCSSSEKCSLAEISASIFIIRSDNCLFTSTAFFLSDSICFEAACFSTVNLRIASLVLKLSSMCFLFES